MKRREFLAYLGLFTASCHGVLSKTLKQDCFQPRLEDKLRVMTYNIANARGNYEELFKSRNKEAIKFNLDQIAEMVSYYDIDVLCMNEVDFSSARTHNINQAEYLAKRLCYNHLIEESMFKMPCFDVGNAVISKYPLKQNHYHQYGKDFIDRIKHVFKSFLDFDVNDLNFVLTHLDSTDEQNRIMEVEILLDYLNKKKEPFVLLGDFNSGPGSKPFEKIIKSGLVHNKYVGIKTFRSDNPKYSIDHILVSKELELNNYSSANITCSDHRPVMGDIYLKR